jgi:hypothetical protein
MHCIAPHLHTNGAHQMRSILALGQNLRVLGIDLEEGQDRLPSGLGISTGYWLMPKLAAIAKASAARKTAGQRANPLSCI